MVASAIVLIIIGGSASAYCFVEKRKTKRKSGMTVDDAYLRISKLESEFAKEQELKREMQKNEPAVYFQGVGLLQRMVGESDAALEKRAEHIRKHGHR